MPVVALKIINFQCCGNSQNNFEDFSLQFWGLFVTVLGTFRYNLWKEREREREREREIRMCYIFVAFFHLLIFVWETVTSVLQTNNINIVGDGKLSALWRSMKTQ